MARGTLAWLGINENSLASALVPHVFLLCVLYFHRGVLF